MLTDTPLCVADVLERAADLIEPEGAWIRGSFVGERNGIECFCAMGAIDRAAGTDQDLDETVIFSTLRKVIGRQSIVSWNDSPERTQPEVVAALRRAATLARAGDA
ncbi:hypothetical protein [Sphingomonas sp. R86520]|uniref:DUF6197 family protein n=1 Tax=Sphingomonas sp. R86520 TaxID=3093859 RepID=UPI0036D33971